MANRQEVFRSKVLQRLFPEAPKVEREPSPPCVLGAPAKKPFVKRTKTQEDTAAGDAEQTKSAAVPHPRVYTVLPPPADYKTHPEESATLSQLERINSAKDPAEESVHESDEDPDQDKEREEHKRKRKRRKKKPGPPHQDSGRDDAAPGRSQSVAVVEGGKHISRNKKRKLKKKRHKEKLLSKGEMPRAAALEFTYQKDGGEEEEEEEEDNERRAAEVSDFLRTTLEIYLSDPKLHVDNKSPRLSTTVDDLLSHISSGREPNSVLKQLYSLKTSVQHKETATLEQALQELHNSSSVTADEHAAVASLFQYWITDILPLRADKTPGLSATHPRDCQSH